MYIMSISALFEKRLERGPPECCLDDAMEPAMPSRLHLQKQRLDQIGTLYWLVVSTPILI